jgi:rubrerythrin
MIETNPIEIIEESIQLELNVAELYRIFQEGFPEDAGFWQELHREEKSHASLLRTARDSFIKRGNFPSNLVADSLETLKASNAVVERLARKYAQALPSRREACETAIQVEESAGESHYLDFMEKAPGNSLDTVFQLLNRDDKNHAMRIREYLDRNLAPA